VDMATPRPPTQPPWLRGRSLAIGSMVLAIVLIGLGLALIPRGAPHRPSGAAPLATATATATPTPTPTAPPPDGARPPAQVRRRRAGADQAAQADRAEPPEPAAAPIHTHHLPTRTDLAPKNVREHEPGDIMTEILTHHLVNPHVITVVDAADTHLLNHLREAR